MFENIGKTEIIILVVVLLIIFGPKKLPEFTKGITDSVKEIFSAFNGAPKKSKEEKHKK